MRRWAVSIAEGHTHSRTGCGPAPPCCSRSFTFLSLHLCCARRVRAPPMSRLLARA